MIQSTSDTTTRLLKRLSNSGIYFIRWATNDGRALEVDPAFAAKLGYSVDEFMQLTLADVDPNIPREALTQFVETIRGVPGDARFEVQAKHKDGSFLDLSVNTTIEFSEEHQCESFFSFVMDISSARQQAKRLEMILDGASLGTWDWNLKTSEIVFDRRWCGMLGYDVGDLAPTLESWSSRVHPDDLDAALSAIDAHLEGRTDYYESAHRLKHKDGHWIYILSRGRVMEHNSAGEPLLFSGIHTDISEVYRLQNQLSETLSKLRRTNERQNQLFGVIAHELRTPAAAIQMLAKELQISESDRDELLSVTDHLLKVIDDLRVTVNPELEVEIKRRPFDLATLIREVERQTSTLASNYGFVLDLSGANLSSEWFISDAYRLRVVLTNLIRNSVFHSNGTCIWLSVDVVRNGADAMLTFQVEDNGKGIPLDQVDRLFKPFERGDTKATGTGIGMHLIKSWIEVLGGEAAYKHSSHGGACFTITLPAPPAPSTKDVSAEDTSTEDVQLLEAKAALQGKRVMLVEDDDLLRKATVRLLQKHFDINIVVAVDGQQALETLKHESIDLLISDYFMPHLNGRELILELRRQGKTLPIIALTAATIGAEKDDLREAGADVVLSKPLNIDSFAREILPLATR